MKFFLRQYTKTTLVRIAQLFLVALFLPTAALAAHRITSAVVRYQPYPNYYDINGYAKSAHEAALGYMNKIVCNSPSAYGCKIINATSEIICDPWCRIRWRADGRYTWRDVTGKYPDEVRNYQNFGGGSIVGCPSGYYEHMDQQGVHCWSNDKEPTVDKNKGRCPDGQCCIGNPINPGIGNKFQIESDYFSASSMPLRLRRYYNSIGPLTRGALGMQWRHEYERFIGIGNTHADIATAGIDNINAYVFPAPVAKDPKPLPASNIPALIPSTTVTRPDGKVLHFSLLNNVWTSDADITDRLIHLTDNAGNTTGWQYTTSHDNEVETYDLSGRLISITTRSGLKTILSYDSSKRLSSVTDAFGRSLTFAYDAANRITSITDPASGNYRFEYDGASSNCAGNGCNNLTAVIYPDGKKRVYWYNESNLTGGQNQPHVLTGITDENGIRFATFSYDSKGRAVSTEHGNSVDKYSVTYSQAYAQKMVTDPLGNNRTYNFETLLGVVRSIGISQPSGSGCNAASSNLSYDINGNIASRIDFNGIKTIYTYDTNRNLETSRTEGVGTPQARTISTAWHPTWRLPVKIAAPKQLTTNTYDDKGNLLTRKVQATTDETGAQGFNATVVGAPRTWSYTYNQFGQVLTAKGPRTDVDDSTTYTYDNQGNVATITNALGETTTFKNYDPNGRVGTIVDANGITTDLTYSPRGWLTSKTTAGETTGYDYDGVGQLLKVTLANGATLHYTYDDAHRLTGISDSTGNSIVYTLDAMGNRIKEQVKDPNGNLARHTTRVYDALNRLQQVTGGMQ